MKRLLSPLCVGMLFSVLLLPSEASATAFSFSDYLVGDPRVSNPDDILIKVTVTGDTTSNQTYWVVDLQMNQSHPDAKLNEFYWNMFGNLDTYVASNFNPTGWSFTAPASVNGGSGVQFMFEANDTINGSSNNVTNTQNLTFTLTKTTGNFLMSDFFNATQTCMQEVNNACGQLGAHVQSLGPTANESGFALGNYTPPPPVSIPEPAAVALFGAGLAMMAAWMRRTRREPKQKTR